MPALVPSCRCGESEQAIFNRVVRQHALPPLRSTSTTRGGRSTPSPSCRGSSVGTTHGVNAVAETSAGVATAQTLAGWRNGDTDRVVVPGGALPALRCCATLPRPWPLRWVWFAWRCRAAAWGDPVPADTSSPDSSTQPTTQLFMRVLTPPLPQTPSKVRSVNLAGIQRAKCAMDVSWSWTW